MRPRPDPDSNPGDHAPTGTYPGKSHPQPSSFILTLTATFVLTLAFTLALTLALTLILTLTLIHADQPFAVVCDGQSVGCTRQEGSRRKLLQKGAPGMGA